MVLLLVGIADGLAVRYGARARQRRERANRTVESLWRWSSESELPVVVDASSCSLGLAGEAASSLSEENRERHEQLEILDSIAWAKRLLPEL